MKETGAQKEKLEETSAVWTNIQEQNEIYIYRMCTLELFLYVLGYIFDKLYIRYR